MKVWKYSNRSRKADPFYGRSAAPIYLARAGTRKRRYGAPKCVDEWHWGLGYVARILLRVSVLRHLLSCTRRLTQPSPNEKLSSSIPCMSFTEPCWSFILKILAVNPGDALTSIYALDKTSGQWAVSTSLEREGIETWNGVLTFIPQNYRRLWNTADKPQANDFWMKAPQNAFQLVSSFLNLGYIILRYTMHSWWSNCKLERRGTGGRRPGEISW